MHIPKNNLTFADDMTKFFILFVASLCLQRVFAYTVDTLPNVFASLTAGNMPMSITAFPMPMPTAYSRLCSSRGIAAGVSAM